MRRHTVVSQGIDGIEQMAAIHHRPGEPRRQRPGTQLSNRLGNILEKHVAYVMTERVVDDQLSGSTKAPPAWRSSRCDRAMVCRNGL